ncbi:MAG: hypothetical protein WA159_09820, partial [Variovorax sp.]
MTAAHTATATATDTAPHTAVRTDTGWDAQRLAAWSGPHLANVEAALSRWVGIDAPVQLGDAMRYAVLDGGKRLRPLLVMA